MRFPMRRVAVFATASLLVLCSARIARCQEQPNVVSVCELTNDPALYNHEVVKVTAFVSHDFEDFTLFDPTCSSWPGVWLEYGGTSVSGTMYCCGVADARHRPKELAVEGIAIPLLDDDLFREFDKLIQPPFRSARHGSIVHATIVGRFFSGKEIHHPKATFWGGYGHMGCCSLLAIEQIESVDPQDRDDLDYGASPDQPDIGGVGCGYQFLTSPVQSASVLIDAQEMADSETLSWMFNDPKRVAEDAFARFANIDPESVTGVKEQRRAQGRFVYEWQPSRARDNYMVVISRPYWLSFYAHDPNRVAWVVIAAYASSCGKGNSVVRIH